MKIKIIITLLFFSVSITGQPHDQTVPGHQDFSSPNNSNFIIGADVTELEKIEDNGGIFQVNGVKKDALEILHNHWFSTMRLTLFHATNDKYKSLENVIAMAKRIKNSGLKFLLNPHYSDTWANPGQQIKPAAWQNLSFEVLKDSVYSYSKNTISEFKKQGVLPDMVQIGNEITSGMLWNDGRVGGDFESPEQWQKLADLIKAGIRGVKDSLAPDDTVQIMIHLDSGTFKETTLWFLDHLVAQGVDFDVLGLSFYSYWGGRMSGLQDNLSAVTQKYDKDIILIETSYPWILKDYDQVPNWMLDPNRLHPGYPASVAGQQAFLEDAITILKNLANGRGKGLFYWQPTDISPPFGGSGNENTTLFDFKGVLLPSVKAFTPQSVVQVHVSLNAASIPDTLGKTSFFELRGALDWNAPTILPDGNILDWSEKSEIELLHKGGDQYEAVFYVPIGSELRYKFWSQDIWKNGFGNGWETGDANGDNDGNKLLSVLGDTTLPLHFFNGMDAKKPYDWRPWDIKEDSIAVRFRVFMNTVEGFTDGYDPEIINQEIGVRGDDLNGSGPLEWNGSHIKLAREWDDKKQSGFHLFSGAAYFPKSLAGRVQAYKFFIEPNGWEEGNLSGDRFFTIPTQDTTLHWVYYGNTVPLAIGPAKITLRLNAASIPDTIRNDAFFQVRGAIDGVAPFTLPDGNILDWGEQSSLILKNTGGDYFETSFVVPYNSELSFKFWSREVDEHDPGNGWEAGDLSGDNFGNRIDKALANTTLAIHFFNNTGERQSYDWKLWEPKSDSVAVWFRVFMNSVEGVNDGYDPQNKNQVIGVRGNQFAWWQSGPLDWGKAKVVLKRESSDANSAGYHLFSGVAYYPKLEVVKLVQEYKFVLEPDRWEEGNLKGNRKFIVPDHDTTLHYVFYGNTAPVAPSEILENPGVQVPLEYSLRNNYPNPFFAERGSAFSAKSTTVIEYDLPQFSQVRLDIYNVLGNRIKTLVSTKQHAGHFQATWDGTDDQNALVAAGIYFCRIHAEALSIRSQAGQSFVKVIKQALVK